MGVGVLLKMFIAFINTAPVRRPGVGGSGEARVCARSTLKCKVSIALSWSPKEEWGACIERAVSI